MARPYKKTSSYWSQPRKVDSLVNNIPAIKQAPDPELMPAFAGEENHYSAQANCGGSPNNSAYRNQMSPTVTPGAGAPFPLLSAGLVPFQMIGQGGNGFAGGNGSYSMAGPIGISMQAYWNTAIVRNSIDMMVNYSVSPLKIRTENATVKNFFTNWFQAINLNSFQAQYFLEYYRSGNVFIYKFNGKIQDDDFEKMTQAFSAKKAIIPIRYIILNPLQVFLQTGANTPNSYVRALSPFEITRLANPQTPEDKEVFDQLPESTKKSIKSGGNWVFVTIPLDPKRLYYTFYKKQDYEPLAVPMIFPVLNDIEFKLLLKKMDMSLASTMEQVILLITTGQKADQYQAATGKKSLEALQNLFQNQSIGRVLVADHTTKGEWLIPDLKELLGYEKYTRVDADIKEGLQYMFFGEEKFANAAIKAQIFIESLKEGRRLFLENFLMPEVRKICEIMNFKHIPTLEFEDIQLQDQALMAKLYYQMGQLGLLTASETVEAIQTGYLPDEEESVTNQTEYKKLRDKGLYEPLLGKPQDGGAGSPGGKTGPVKKAVKTPIGQTKADWKISPSVLADNLLKMNNLRDNVEKSLLKKFKIKNLNDAQKNVAQSIAKSIIINESDDKTWKTSIASYLEKPKEIGKEITDELTDIAVEFDIGLWDAVLMRKSKNVD